jgi:hypothetical protein
MVCQIIVNNSQMILAEDLRRSFDHVGVLLVSSVVLMGISAWVLRRQSAVAAII